MKGVKYSDIDLKNKGIEWDVVDGNDKFEMVHYLDDVDLENSGSRILKGIIVDKEDNKVVVSSYPYTKTLVFDEENLQEFANKQCKNPKFYMGFEGTILRFAKWKGEFIVSTHKKIDGRKSSWACNSDKFYNIYLQNGGVKVEDMFDNEYETSNYCHIFLVVHPDIMICSKLDTKGFNVYLTTVNNGPVESAEKIQDFVNGKFEDILKGSRCTIRSTELTTEEAERHLKFGFINHPLGGEFIIMVDGQNIEDFENIYRVISKEYESRYFIRDNYPNIYNRYRIMKDNSESYPLSMIRKGIKNLLPKDCFKEVIETKDIQFIILMSAIPMENIRKNIDLPERYRCHLDYFVDYYIKTEGSGVHIPNFMKKSIPKNNNKETVKKQIKQRMSCNDIFKAYRNIKFEESKKVVE